MKCFLPLLAAGLVFGQAAPPPANSDPVVITVGDQKITRSQFERILSTIPQPQRAQLANPVARRKLAENYAELMLLAQEARARKIDQSEKVKAEIALQTDRVLASNVVEQLSEPTDGDELAYYNSHKNEYEQVKARHILIRFKGSQVPLKKDEKDLTEEEALAKANEIRQKILAGGDFSELAKQESDDAGNADRGGDLGTFTRGRMVPEFEKAAFAAEIGKVTEPVKTKFGYHLILVDSRETKPFAEVRPQIEQKLKQDNTQKTIADLKKKAAITYDDAYFGAPPAPPAKQNLR
ncbi:MAG TPA: peptidylprolyl isomerase [Bryobacteraceae bacterium]|jgi:peptidyl-prolyl cis-trans isomerase C|nr:peptidylprolyl isomerase [Bryobacteraceae bacterium]